MHQDAQSIQKDIESAREDLQQTVEAIVHKADVVSQVKATVHEKVDALTTNVKQVFSKTQTTVNGAFDGVTSHPEYHEGKQGIERLARANPLGFILGSVAAGFMLGSLIPATKIENERVGEIGDRLLGSAKLQSDVLLARGKAKINESASDFMNKAFTRVS